MQQVHVFISGKVQGVFFRDSTRRQAQALGVNGWVRNLPDGRVEGVFQGEEKAVDELLAWCKQGPERARVSDLVVEPQAPEEAFEGFRVRSTPS
ncbi:MAG: acylphosphatase [Candidatus Thermoplasmatota archaeon]|nr:acylphosphatase [Candidatus Thermoplasmatota archaeon]